jgi:hypothetical protein
LRSLRTLLLTILIVLPLLSPAAVVPVKSVLRLTLNEAPSQDSFACYLVFQSYEHEAKLVKFTFSKTGDLIYESILDESSPQELQKLQDMCLEDNRDFWDEMLLENRGEIPALSIKHLMFTVTYNSTTKGCINDITMLDWDVDQSFEQSYSKIYLNSYARFSRLKWVSETVKSITGKNYSYDADTCPAFLAAVRDIGKCGTSGFNFYDTNPKYGAGDANLCSEFVSWYYYHEGTPFGKRDFKDIRSATNLINLFAQVERKYDYNNLTKRFEHPITMEAYQPQPGDYLWRTNQGHAMIIAGWNEEANIAAVINGPWPVTLRTVEIQKDEDQSDKEYCIGRMNEVFKSKQVDKIARPRPFKR